METTAVIMVREGQNPHRSAAVNIMCELIGMRQLVTGFTHLLVLYSTCFSGTCKVVLAISERLPHPIIFVLIKRNEFSVRSKCLFLYYVLREFLAVAVRRIARLILKD